jgi:hypothetical protein
MTVRDGTAYADHLRRRAYEAAHPDTRITSYGAWWQAVITGEASETVITRHKLADLLDRLDAAED